MPRRALALATSIGLLLGIALPAAARNINAENSYAVDLLWSVGVPRPRRRHGLPTSSTAGGCRTARPRHGGSRTKARNTSTLYNGSNGRKGRARRNGRGRSDRRRSSTARATSWSTPQGLLGRPGSSLRPRRARSTAGIPVGTTGDRGGRDRADAVYLGAGERESMVISNFLYAANFHSGHRRRVQRDVRTGVARRDHSRDSDPARRLCAVRYPDPRRPASTSPTPSRTRTRRRRSRARASAS